MNNNYFFVQYSFCVTRTHDNQYSFPDSLLFMYDLLQCVCCRWYLIITNFLYFFLADIVCGLRITKVSVPTPVVVSDSVWLECDFVEEQENVYALKWYLGLDEFYRWTPAESPSVKTFPVRGNPLVVDTTASHRGRVRIHDVKLGATGVFRCEVSAEAPSFHTESEVDTMTVLGECQSQRHCPG